MTSRVGALPNASNHTNTVDPLSAQAYSPAKARLLRPGLRFNPAHPATPKSSSSRRGSVCVVAGGPEVSYGWTLCPPKKAATLARTTCTFTKNTFTNQRFSRTTPTRKNRCLWAPGPACALPGHSVCAEDVELDRSSATIMPVAKGALAHAVAYLAFVAVLTETRRELDAVRAVAGGHRALDGEERDDERAQVERFVEVQLEGAAATARLHADVTAKEVEAKLNAMGDRADHLELQLAVLQEEKQQARGDASDDVDTRSARSATNKQRRRAQRTGAETAHIIRVETTTITCPIHSGRFGLSECQDSAFERCHQEACARILGGHRRRMQAVGSQQCTADTLPARSAAVNSACCPGDGCINGHPDTCTIACAGVFLSWWRDWCAFASYKCHFELIFRAFLSDKMLPTAQRGVAREERP